MWSFQESALVQLQLLWKRYKNQNVFCSIEHLDRSRTGSENTPHMLTTIQDQGQRCESNITPPLFVTTQKMKQEQFSQFFRQQKKKKAYVENN